MFLNRLEINKFFNFEVYYTNCGEDVPAINLFGVQLDVANRRNCLDSQIAARSEVEPENILRRAKVRADFSLDSLNRTRHTAAP